MTRPLLNFAAGLEQKELGLFATALNNQDFVARARDVAMYICRLKGSVTMDEVRVHVDMKGWTPSSPNAYGAIFHTAHWKQVSYEKSHLKSNRARRIVRWTYQP